LETGELKHLTHLFAKTNYWNGVVCIAAAFQWRKTEPKLRLTGEMQA